MVNTWKESQMVAAWCPILSCCNTPSEYSGAYPQMTGTEIVRKDIDRGSKAF